MSEIAISELIHVKQLPIIEEQLRSLKEWVDAETAEAVRLVCTEDTIQSVKAKRAELRKKFNELESLRKAIKAAIMAPLEQFEAVYKECASNAFRAADADLKRKIDDVEREIKDRCETDLRDYFDELCAAHHIDWMDFESTGVKVDMASAKQKTPKKLREQIAKFVVKVAQDIETISTMESAEEIQVAYKSTLDLARSIGIVQDRHRRIEAEREAAAVRAEALKAEKETARKVEALAPPTVMVEPEKLTVTFTVADTRERLIALREWMKANGYQYK